MINELCLLLFIHVLLWNYWQRLRILNDKLLSVCAHMWNTAWPSHRLIMKMKKMIYGWTIFLVLFRRCQRSWGLPMIPPHQSCVFCYPPEMKIILAAWKVVRNLKRRRKNSKLLYTLYVPCPLCIFWVGIHCKPKQLCLFIVAKMFADAFRHIRYHLIWGEAKSNITTAWHGPFVSACARNIHEWVQKMHELIFLINLVHCCLYRISV